MFLGTCQKVCSKLSTGSCPMDQDDFPWGQRFVLLSGIVTTHKLPFTGSWGSYTSWISKPKEQIMNYICKLFQLFSIAQSKHSYLNNIALSPPHMRDRSVQDYIFLQSSLQVRKELEHISKISKAPGVSWCSHFCLSSFKITLWYFSRSQSPEFRCI